MSTFEQIIGDTKLDGEIEAIEFVLNNILNDYPEGRYQEPNDVQKIKWLLRGYLIELMDLKHDQ